MDNKKKIGLPVGIIGALLTMVSLLLPYAKARRESKSLVGIAKYYLESSSSEWHDKDYETFYKIFVPVMIGLILLFTIIYIVKCMKMRTVGMIITTILTVIAYEVLKWDFADRGIVPGAYDKGVAFTTFYIAFALMIVGAVMRIVESRQTKNNDNNVS